MPATMKLKFALSLSAALSVAFVGGFACGNWPWLHLDVAGWLKERFGSEPAHDPAGRWAKAPGEMTRSGNDDHLLSLGYAAGVRSTGSKASVTIHDATAASAGFNLFTSGHAPEALLTDMQGRVLHHWSATFDSVWPGRSSEGGRADYWRRGHLYANGNYLAMFDQLGLVELDSASKVLWSKAIACHHDLEVLADGRIFVLTRKEVTRPDLRHGKPTWEDAITILDATGLEIDSLSLVEALRNSSYAPVLQRTPDDDDILHTNTIEVLGGECAHISPLFRRGNVLVSFRTIDLIAIVDMDARRVVWALSGLFDAQHDPTLTREGHILLFDNLGAGSTSRVLELEPFTQQVLWSYAGSAAHPFFSKFCGTNYVLPNGNVLVTESEGGRAFELARDGRIVWEYYSPFRAGEHAELIAVIFDLQRLPPDFPLGWASGGEAGQSSPRTK